MTNTKVKKFDSDLYNKYNEIALESAKAFYKDVFNIKCIKPYDYKLDLKFLPNPSNCIGVEVEVRPVWKSFQKHFPYPTIHVPGRKQKLVDSYDQESLKRIQFIAFNGNCTRLLLTNFKTILHSPLVEVSNKYLKNDEYFFNVELENFSPYDLVDGIWVKR